MKKNRVMKKIVVVSLLGAGVVGLSACNITPNGQVNYGGDSGYSTTASYTAPSESYSAPSYDYGPPPAPPAGWQQGQDPTYDTPSSYEAAPGSDCGYGAFDLWACPE